MNKYNVYLFDTKNEIKINANENFHIYKYDEEYANVFSMEKIKISKCDILILNLNVEFDISIFNMLFNLFDSINDNASLIVYSKNEWVINNKFFKFKENVIMFDNVEDIYDFICFC